ncbi:MAG: CRISPR-associated RAMP protein [Acidimicrobiia bacterium]
MSTVTSWTVTLVDVAFETVTGLRVGGERSGASTTDMPLLRWPDGRPYIPGSSLKGVLRSGAERILRSLGVTPAVCDVLVAPCGGRLQKDVDPVPFEQLCWVCRTFGSPHAAGRLFVGELCPEGPVDTVVRDGVGIDRNELRAADNIKYDFEVVPPGARFSGRLRLDDGSDADVGLLCLLLDLIDAGLVGVGGGTTRGLGRMRYAAPPAVSRFDAAAFVAASPHPTAVDLDAARAAARTVLEEGRTP